MRLTFIVTIDPVKDTSLLNILIHSLNLQTTRDFNVIFYNQTLMSEEAIFAKLNVKPIFEYAVYHINKEYFLGKYPLWDLYRLHNILLDDNVLNEYFMSLHMEEFLDIDYVENAIQILQTHNFDIMFGGLSRTRMNYNAIKSILDTHTMEEFNSYLIYTGVKDSYHWSFKYEPLFHSKDINTLDINTLKQNAMKLFLFRLRRTLKATNKGYINVGMYMAEDVYLMKREFAKRYNWFLRGHPMYFEDIHICEQRGTCELGKELKKITRFPIYFNRRKIYHIEHEKYYYQLVDNEFTRLMLGYQTDDPILTALKKAITMYREKNLSFDQALTYTRKNIEGTGTQNLNYKYHMMYLGDGSK